MPAMWLEHSDPEGEGERRKGSRRRSSVAAHALVFYGYQMKSRPPKDEEGRTRVIDFGNYRYAVAAAESIMMERGLAPFTPLYPDIQWVANLNWYIRERHLESEKAGGLGWFWGVIHAKKNI